MAYSIRLLGTKANPVRCSGERGLRLYLQGLFDELGMPVEFKKVDEDGNLDIYELYTSCSKPKLLYFDKFHIGYSEKTIVAGFKTYKDFINYRIFTKVAYYNHLLKSNGFSNDYPGYFRLWKLCGTLLSFGPGFYASEDVEGMPLPFFNQTELMKHAEMVVHALCGIDPGRPLFFEHERLMMEFLGTFHLELESRGNYPTEVSEESMRLDAHFKYEHLPLTLWVEGLVASEKYE